MTTTLRATIEALEQIRAGAHADLTARTTPHPDPQWTADRVADIEWCNRQLQQLGASPG